MHKTFSIQSTVYLKYLRTIELLNNTVIGLTYSYILLRISRPQYLGLNTSHDQVDLLDTDGIYEEITDADCTAFKQAIGNWCSK